MIDWLEVDGVRYAAQGENILCQTAVGFQTLLPGHQLDGLEISDEQGNPLGFLNVDFQLGHMELTPLVATAELEGTVLRFGDVAGEHQVALTQLPVPVLTLSLQDGDMMLTDTSAALTEEHSHGNSLALTSIVSDADETLDTFFGASTQSDPEHLPVLESPAVSDIDYLYLTHGADPIQMPLLPEYPDNGILI